MFAYKKLKESGISFSYEGRKIQLIPKFEYNKEKVRECTYTPDFVGDGWILEIKGFSNDVFPIKWKLLKYLLYKTEENNELYLVKNQKGVNEVIEKIKQLQINGKS